MIFKCEFLNMERRTFQRRTRLEKKDDRVSSRYLWPEYEIIHEQESEFELETSQTSGSTSLVPKDTTDESLNSLLNQFESDEETRTWATLQERLARAPSQVLRPHPAPSRRRPPYAIRRPSLFVALRRTQLPSSTVALHRPSPSFRRSSRHSSTITLRHSLSHAASSVDRRSPSIVAFLPSQLSPFAVSCPPSQLSPYAIVPWFCRKSSQEHHSFFSVVKMSDNLMENSGERPKISSYEPLSLKRSYRCVPTLQQFYTGGAIVVSSDGSFIACACGDSIKIVDSPTSSLRSTIECGESESLTALCLSPDDKLLFSAGHSRQIMVWDLATLKCVRTWKGHDGPVMGMACHPSGGLLATAGADKKVLVWDVDGGFCTHYFKGHKSVVSSILFHFEPDKQLLFSGSDDGSVRVWDLLTKKIIATLEHEATVTSLSISEDGWTLLSAGRDKVVKLWDLHNYSCKKTMITFEVLEGVCVIRAGTSFASCLDSHEQHMNKNGGVQVVNFVTVGERGIVRLWSSESSICLFEQKSIDVAASVDPDDQRRGFKAVFLLPSDKGLLCVTADHQFLFYSPLKTPDNQLKITLRKRLVGSNEEIVDMKFLGEDEQFLAVATNVEQVRVYDLASMSCSYILAGHTEIVLCLDTCVTSLGKILIVTGSKDNNVRLWDSESKSCVGVGLGHMGAVGAVAFSKKRRDFFVSGSSDRTIKVWSLDGLSNNLEQAINLKAKAIVAAHDKDINSLAVAPNDSLVCSGSEDRTACIWRLPDLVSIVVLKGHKRAVWSVEFSPVDQCVLTASGDKTIKIWAISDGSCLKTFEGHTASVLRASFLTRGTQIISCGADGLLKLWTVKTNECIATYDKHEDKVWALTVGKKTEMLATGGGDAVVNLWYDSTTADREEAIRKEEEVVLKGQELENALSDSDYTKAIQIALELRRPHRLFELFAELCRKRDAENNVGKVLGDLEKEEFSLLFEYIREWNTKPKLCHVAHFVLFRVLNILSPKDIIELKGIGELLEGLIPYSQRHFSRVDRLVRSSFLLDYTLTEMSVLEPENNTIVSEAARLNEPAQILEEKEKSTTRKRKSKKSKNGSHKKARAETDAPVAAISLQA